MVYFAILAKFPGSVHDLLKWKLSFVGSYVENHFMVGKRILEDSGYMLKTCLLTPYRQPTTSPQENHNYAHTKIRVLIEQTFGRSKRRFPCLHCEIRIATDKVCTLLLRVLCYTIWQLFCRNQCWKNRAGYREC